MYGTYSNDKLRKLKILFGLGLLTGKQVQQIESAFWHFNYSIMFTQN